MADVRVQKALILLLLAGLVLVLPAAAAATTSLTVKKLASDGTTVLDSETVDYTWMMNNRPVVGDGVTHYFHQGPVLLDDPDDATEQLLRFNKAEDNNILEKDYGAVKGTNLKDLCDLVGGMNAGETVEVRATDGFFKTFPYENVYTPPDLQGPMAITWYCTGISTCTGPYPDSGYADGMRLVFFPDETLDPDPNPWGENSYGNWDMHESMPEAYWYYYYGTGTPPEKYPTTTGYTVKWVSEIIIHSDDPAPVMDVLFDGTVTLAPYPATYDQVAYTSGLTYAVNESSPMGALHAASVAAGFTYGVSDKNVATSGSLLVDNIDTYLYQKTPRKAWYAYVNDVYKDGFNNAANGLNTIILNDGDTVEFYYVDGAVANPTDLTAVKAAASAAVKTVASTGVTPTDWSIVLDGAKTETVTKAYFEEGLTHASHYGEYTDASGTWSGMPLYLLIGMVDDDPDPSAPHYDFNDVLAGLGYDVKITASDGYTATLKSEDIAANKDGFIVANKLNDEYLPPDDGGVPPKPIWPLMLKGDGVFGGNQIGGIEKIELISIPEPPSGWTLKVKGTITDTITQEEFEAAVAHGHMASWTDSKGNVYSGVPLYYLVGVADDYETTDHWTFNDALADTNYEVQVWDLDTEGTPPDPFSASFYSVDFANSDAFLLANMKNGVELPETEYPLRLVGSGTTSGSQRVSKVDEIWIPSLFTPDPVPGSYNLYLEGKISDVISQAELEAAINCPEHTRTVSVTTGGATYLYRGIPLWYLAGWVDDRIPHGGNAFNAAQAIAGYRIMVTDVDTDPDYTRDFQSSAVAWSDSYIVANARSSDGGATFAPLPSSEWPLRLVGPGASGSLSVRGIDTITLTDFSVPSEAPKLHIVKYDGTTIVDEEWIDYTEMIAQFDTIGDGTTQYKFQAVTMDPADIWDSDESFTESKISNAVKGTRLLDLVGLVGDMGVGTDLVLVASDGYKTTLPYTSVHTTTDIQARQGDAILAWYADGKYVPSYADGMRLFFMPDDHFYGQWDMHETMPAGYWHYYYQTYAPPSPYAPGILYPSAAGLSAKYITEIRVYSTPETTWNLLLDGTRVGGITYTVAKTYFEAALACQMGANHEASYTDSSGNVWIGMPLWFLQGFVDDADQHSNNAYNEELALQGYDIIVKASDGYSKTFSSVETVRSDGYIVANTLNGYHIPATDPSWPLRLVGSSVPKSNNVKKVSEIVLNLRPKIDSLTVPTTPVLTTGSATATAAFTDPYDTHTAVFDWGDGLTSAGLVDETAHTVTGTHTYAQPGFYTVSVTLIDSMDITATATSEGTVIVYDPKSGFVTGLGSIKSPAGAYTANPSLTGPATLELLARYPVVINRPFTGVTAFQFVKAKMAFRSTSYDWLVIQKEAKKAFYKGSGKIGGKGDYGFLVAVIDGGSRPALDRFRIKIWNKANGAVIYDTQPGAADTADPTTPLTLGGLVVDKLLG